MTRINRYSRLHYGADDQLKDAGIKAQGELIGNYDLKEEPRKTSCGVFEGKMTLCWYVDKHGNLHYDDIGSDDPDGYKNNQYEGTWKPHGGGKQKIANWGEYRIPASGDLDIGAGEFSPNPGYSEQGWKHFAH